MHSTSFTVPKSATTRMREGDRTAAGVQTAQNAWTTATVKTNTELPLGRCAASQRRGFAVRVRSGFECCVKLYLHTWAGVM